MASYYHARKAKLDAEKIFLGFEKEALRREQDENLLSKNPQIGKLIRKGKPVYYTYDASGNYSESSNLETLL